MTIYDRCTRKISSFASETAMEALTGSPFPSTPPKTTEDEVSQEPVPVTSTAMGLLVKGHRRGRGRCQGWGRGGGHSIGNCVIASSSSTPLVPKLLPPPQ